ncbi:MAG: hypothetical protein NT070_21745 [Cyanobacteria bacterium]|nr:hypothetical protein [Cyanobacteriota bacterium]
MSIFSLSKYFSTALLGLVLLPLIQAPAIADEPAQAPILPVGDLRPEATTDPFSTRGDNSSAIMGLIHRVMRGDGNIDRAAEAESRRENINDATSDFFAKRNQLLKPKSAALPGSILVPSGIAPLPTAAPSSGTALILRGTSAPMTPTIVSPTVVPVSP